MHIMQQANIYRKVCQVPERGYKASVHEMNDLCTDGAGNMGIYRKIQSVGT